MIAREVITTGEVTEWEQEGEDMQQQIDRFLASLASKKGKKGKENTVAAYHNDLGQFFAYVHDRRRDGTPTTWSDISTNDIIDYVLDLKQREYAAASIARKIAAIKSFFHYLMDTQIVSDDRSKPITTPAVLKAPPQIMDQATVELLLAAPAQGSHPKALRDSALLELLYATGMRTSEIAALNINDVSLQAHIVWCERYDKDTRAIHLSERAANALATYLADGRPHLTGIRAKNEALFVNHRGQRLTRQGLWLIVKSYAEQIGMAADVTPHVLRSSSATHRLASGTADMVSEVQNALGHASRATTLIYAGLTAQRAAENDQQGGNS